MEGKEELCVVSKQVVHRLDESTEWGCMHEQRTKN